MGNYGTSPKCFGCELVNLSVFGSLSSLRRPLHVNIFLGSAVISQIRLAWKWFWAWWLWPAWPVLVKKKPPNSFWKIIETNSSTTNIKATIQLSLIPSKLSYEFNLPVFSTECPKRLSDSWLICNSLSWLDVLSAKDHRGCWRFHHLPSLIPQWP